MGLNTPQLCQGFSSAVVAHLPEWKGLPLKTPIKFFTYSSTTLFPSLPPHVNGSNFSFPRGKPSRNLKRWLFSSLESGSGQQPIRVQDCSCKFQTTTHPLSTASSKKVKLLLDLRLITNEISEKVINTNFIGINVLKRFLNVLVI